MRSTIRMVGSTLALASAAALAQPVAGSGLALPEFQGRVRLGMSVDADPFDAAVAAQSPRLRSAHVFGDYYFSRTEGQPGEASGFRATSGLLLGSRLASWGGPDLWAPGASGFVVEAHRFSLANMGALEPNDGADAGPVPYLGVGYSSWSAKGGWGFSADLGLMALNPGAAIRFGRSLGAGQSLDETLRNIRLSPMLQIGVSYAF